MIKNLIILCLGSIYVHALNQCAFVAKAPEFHLIGNCYRSQMAIMYQANVGSLKQCERITLLRKGLAFNFSPPEVAVEVEVTEDEPFYTCQVLTCPETEIGLTLMNDTRYDYYSMYADPLPRVNTTCVTTIGIFSLEMDRSNFTKAIDKCKRFNSTLADPSSDQRNNAIADLILQRGINDAYVGLWRTNGSYFMDNLRNRSLGCTNYRAWAPGHPRNSYRKMDCIAIDKQKTWKVVQCARKLPFICELIPQGPYREGGLNTTMKDAMKTDKKNM